MHELQSALAEVQQQLSHETRRAHLLEQELTHLRSLTLQHTGQQSASVDGITKHYAQGAIFPSGTELAPASSGQEKDTAPLDAVQRPRPKSMDGYTQTAGNLNEQMGRQRSAPTQGTPQEPPVNADKTVSTALHAVSGAYLKEQAAISTAARERRSQIPSSATAESEMMALQFIEEAQPVPLSQESNTVTISRPAFELLVLKDRAINAVKEGITIAECSLPDHPLIFANDAFSQITGYAREEVLGKNCRQVALSALCPVTHVACLCAKVLHGQPKVGLAVHLQWLSISSDLYDRESGVEPSHVACVTHKQQYLALVTNSFRSLHCLHMQEIFMVLHRNVPCACAVSYQIQSLKGKVSVVVR